MSHRGHPTLHLPLPPPQALSSPPTTAATAPFTITTTASTSTRTRSPIPPPPPRPTPRLPKRADALWLQMQQKLAEVELSNTALFFGPEHVRALEELRNAQMQLALAWLGAESDEPVAAGEAGDDVQKRRELSDAQFDRIEAGVEDVARKLDRVAEAMRGVERESRGIWEDEEEQGASADEGLSSGRSGAGTGVGRA